MTTTEVADAAAHVLIVPLGATEQHGPHLPISTDTTIAVAWASQLALAMGDALVAPALPYGSSGEHQSFAGTISIGQDALRLVLIELARSAGVHHRRVIYVSGHAGNHEPLRSAVEQLRAEGHDVAGLVPRLEGADAHAGHTETSIMLYLEPASVRTDRLETGCTEPLHAIIEQLRSGGVVSVAANGVLGDPTASSADDGAMLWQELIAASDLGMERRPRSDRA